MVLVDDPIKGRLVGGCTSVMILKVKALKFESNLTEGRVTVGDLDATPSIFRSHSLQAWAPPMFPFLRVIF